MAAPVLLTIDTELTWGHFARGASWQQNLALSYDPAGVGVPWQLRMLAAHGLKACFFVDPMPALAYGLEPVKRMVGPILDAGQEIQLHLHSFWVSIAEGDSGGADFELTCFPAERQRELVRIARDLLILAGAPPPVAFRAGSFAANEATLDAVAETGMRYDSSHNGSLNPWPSALALDSRTIAPVAHRGVVEVPVGLLEQVRGSLRHLQICAVSSQEMEAALRHAADNEHPLTTIVSHSFELATRDGLRRNGAVCARFERLCRFLAEHRDLLPTVDFDELAHVPLGVAAEPLPPRPLRTAGRIAEQLWANSVYERAL
ncbi:MAG: polysaccharide deacetylase [Pseudomonadota bacterium]|nr:polysaccharide deacetylase [Pseudomonadota bacterium]